MPLRPLNSSRTCGLPAYAPISADAVHTPRPTL